MLVCAGAWTRAHAAEAVQCAADGSRVTLTLVDSRSPEDFVIRHVDAPATASGILGTLAKEPGRWVFHPTLPLLSGETYSAEWRTQTGEMSRAHFRVMPDSLANAPEVTLFPTAPLPANALKIYLHFTQPMEQGVFLERLRLLDATGVEVIGPFRETELWSPDGKRLTVWFHPGRQKTGVNLNTDEGPVLRPDSLYTFVISQTWRNTSGIPLQADRQFSFRTIEADHECPAMERWQIRAPHPGTLEPLKIVFDEPLDDAMLMDAIRVTSGDSAKQIPLAVRILEHGRVWQGRPNAPWQAGDYAYAVNPDLEDLAGNSLAKPFEVDLAAKQNAQSSQPLSKTFRIGP